MDNKPKNNNEAESVTAEKITPQPEKAVTFERDYEPEQVWGTPEDMRKFRQFGGSMEEY